MAIQYRAKETAAHLDLVRSYRQLLAYIQPTVPHSPVDEPYTTCPKQIIQLVQYFSQHSILTDEKSELLYTPVSSMNEALKDIKCGMAYLAEFDKVLAELVQLIFTTIFFNRSSGQGGGSSSAAVGVLWCSNRRNWSKYDVAEFIIHELIHQLVFLDELRFGHYEDLAALALEENFVRSTILEKQRPLDKAFHSMVVATEILLFRAYSGAEYSVIHLNSQRLRNNVINTGQEILTLLKSNPNICQNRLFEITEMCLKSAGGKVCSV